MSSGGPCHYILSCAQTCQNKLFVDYSYLQDRYEITMGVKFINPLTHVALYKWLPRQAKKGFKIFENYLHNLKGLSKQSKNDIRPICLKSIVTEIRRIQSFTKQGFNLLILEVKFIFFLYNNYLGFSKSVTIISRLNFYLPNFLKSKLLSCMALFYYINLIKQLSKPIFTLSQFPYHYEYAKSTNILG